MKAGLKKDMNKYCAYHKDHGHTTEGCLLLHKEVHWLLTKGHLQDLLAQRTIEDVDYKPLSPMVTKVVNVISRGSSLCGAAYSTAKRRERSIVLEGPTQENKWASGAAITFDDSNLRGSSGPHHDRLVISVMIGSC